MAISRVKKEQLAKEPLIISEEKLSLFNTIVEKVGGLNEFEKAMNLWQFKGQKERIEDVISPEELANIFSYDEDGNVYAKKSSPNRKVGEKVGSLGYKGYIKTDIRFGNYCFSPNINKIVFCLHNGCWAKKGYDVDHINGIITDNRPCNLRESTKSQNGSNRSVSKNNKTGLKGVRIYRKGKRTVVAAAVDCRGIRYTKSVTAGERPVEILVQELKAWRDQKSKELFGDFHRS